MVFFLVAEFYFSVFPHIIDSHFICKSDLMVSGSKSWSMLIFPSAMKHLGCFSFHFNVLCWSLTQTYHASVQSILRCIRVSVMIESYVIRHAFLLFLAFHMCICI